MEDDDVLRRPQIRWDKGKMMMMAVLFVSFGQIIQVLDMVYRNLKYCSFLDAATYVYLLWRPF